MINLINSAIKKEENTKYSFFLSGDLLQMSTQKTFLLNKGFDVKQNNVYPCLKPTDVKKALGLIWEFKIDGWWNYEEKYIEFGISTKEELNNYWKK